MQEKRNSYFKCCSTVMSSCRILDRNSCNYCDNRRRFFCEDFLLYSNFQINNAHILGHNGPLDICSVQKTNLYQHIIAGKNFQHTTRPNFFFFSLLHKNSASSNQMRYIYVFFGQRAFRILCSWRLRSEITYCQKKTSMIVVQLVLRVYTQTTHYWFEGYIG